MKSLIIYYSQTGSTRRVAKAIQTGAGQEAGRCDLITIAEATPEILGDYDLIGLGSPVWMGGETPNVRIFLDSLPQQSGTHIFSFNTHGVFPEQYFPSVVRRLKAKGFTVIGTRDWFGTFHYQLAPNPYFTDGHPDEVDLADAEAFGREMVSVSRKIKAGTDALIPPTPEHQFTPQLFVLLEFFQRGGNAHGRVYYDREKCLYPKCTLCMDNCLMGYIDLSADPPRHGSTGSGCNMWMGCTFCELICPTGAIYGKWEAHKKERGIHVVDFNPLARAADRLIESGKLRLLVPREELAQRLYMDAHPKHPRFKISSE